MKRSIIILISVALMGIFTGCEKMGPAGPMGPTGPQGEKGDPASFLWITLNVPEDSWEYIIEGDRSYFAAYINVKEITEDIFDYGLFNVYQCFNYDTEYASKVPLPAPIQFEDKTDPENPVYYTEQVDYEYGIGWVKIFFSISDFFYEREVFTPPAMEFKAIVAYCD